MHVLNSALKRSVENERFIEIQPSSEKNRIKQTEQDS